MRKIVVIDSGSGGLHILKECERVCGGCRFVYVADTLNSPYGLKSKKKLKKIAENLVLALIKKHNPDLFVFACNTLTVCTIKHIRKRFPSFVFVGVEPAVKPAQKFGGKTIVFATNSTIKNLKITLKKIKPKHHKILRVCYPKMPELIDKNLNNINVLEPLVFKIFQAPKYQTAKAVVLGCTHFVAIKSLIKRALPNAEVFESSLAVAKRVCALINNKSTAKNKIKILSTSGDKEKEESLKKYYKTLSAK